MNEPANTLGGIDSSIILAYLAGVLLLGLWIGRRVKSGKDFFVAGRALPFWAIGMSIVVSDIGAMDFIAGAGAAYTYGLPQENFDWIASMPAMLIAAFVFVPFFWRSGVYTISEFLGRRYNAGVQMFSALIWLTFLGITLSVKLWVTAVFLKSILGWEVQTSIWLTVTVVGIYTVSGGLRAVVMTDVLQLVIMLVGGIALVVLTLVEVGGWGEMVQRIESRGDAFKDHFTLLLPHDTESPYPWSGIVFGLGLVMSTSYFVGNQAVIQRTLGARTEWDAKAGMLLAGFFKLLIPIIVYIPGIAALALYDDIALPDQAMPTLVKHILPVGLRGIMFAAFLAALMSSVDSYLNSCVTIFVTDVWSKYRRGVMSIEPSERETLVLGRVLTGGLLITAALTARQFESGETPIYVFIQTALSYFQGPTLAVLLLGILWPRATGWGGLAGLMLGVGMTVSLSHMGERLFPSDDPFLFVSLWSFLFSVAVTVVVSLLTTAHPPERLAGMVYGSVVRRQNEGEES